jgi:midasin
MRPLAPQREDLAAIVAGYLSGVAAGPPVEAVVDFYLAAKAEAVRRRRRSLLTV